MYLQSQKIERDLGVIWPGDPNDVIGLLSFPSFTLLPSTNWSSFLTTGSLLPCDWRKWPLATLNSLYPSTITIKERDSLFFFFNNLQLPLCHQAHSHHHLLWPGINNEYFNSSSISPSHFLQASNIYLKSNSSLSKTALFFIFTMSTFYNQFIVVWHLLWL